MTIQIFPIRFKDDVKPQDDISEMILSSNKKSIDDGDIFLVGIHDKGQFCIVTREAEPSNSEIHHRQPVIIQKSQISNYFNLNNNAVEFLNNVKPPKLKFFEISTDVNNPAKNDPSIINPIK